MSYNDLAYRKAVYAQLLVDLRNHYPNDVDGYGIICEDVPFRERHVPIEAIDAVEGELEAVVKEIDKEMSTYQMQKREPDDKRSKAAGTGAGGKVTRRKSRKA